MPLVNVLINGRAYTVACDEGEEEHLRELSEYFDKRVRELVGVTGSAGDARVLLMAGLIVCDELSSALARVGECEKEIATLKTQRNAMAARDDDALADTLDAASERLEAIAERLTRS